MPGPVNLSVPAAIDGAGLRRHPLALARVRADGSPLVSFQASAYVRGSTELAFWSRTRDQGLAADPRPSAGLADVLRDRRARAARPGDRGPRQSCARPGQRGVRGSAQASASMTPTVSASP